MKIKYFNKIVLAACFAFSACADLDLEPEYEQTPENVYTDFNNYKQVLAKAYGGLALSGQSGPDGRPDISGLDEGASSYLRGYWNVQQLPTDEALIGWFDGTIQDFHGLNWTSNNEFLNAFYSRIYYQVVLANEFIRETSEDRLNDRGIDGSNFEEVRLFQAEVRFLRALSYWHALDLFGNVPFVTEENPVGAFFPEQIERADLFTYIESELLEIQDLLMEPRQNEYARADRAAAWMLLAKLYLNAEVYTGTPRYDDAANYASQVIQAGYTLQPDYSHLFLADNDLSNEIIFPIAFHGVNTRSWGGMTYLISAPVGGSNMNAEDFGINGGWGGLRSTRALVDLFPESSVYSNEAADGEDNRAIFHTEGHNIDIEDIASFTDGFPVTKFKNVTSTGVRGSDPTGTHADTDFPMFRLADAYLIYAEAVLQGGAGSAAEALGYVNALRERAYGDDSGNITQNQLTLDFILDERARELSWEAHRRTDLIRFNRFTTDTYLWQWKGGSRNGTGVSDFRNIYPIPLNDIIANPTLQQNTGY